MAHDVFISYASGDKAVADAACATLEGRRIRCWIAPRDILAGADWGDAITEAISECQVMVLVFSGRSNESDRVRDEVVMAADEGKPGAEAAAEEGQAPAEEAPAGEASTYEGHGGFGDPLGSGGTGPDRAVPGASATGPWQLTLTHTFNRTRNQAVVSQRSSVNLALGMSVTAGWRLQYSVYYDLTERAVTSQGYSLGRDLHCWQASLERRTSGGRSSYYFRIAVKDLPDIKYERRRS